MRVEEGIFIDSNPVQSSVMTRIDVSDKCMNLKKDETEMYSP